MKTLRVGSLFSGIGAFDYGLQCAGMGIVWQVEKDDYCRGILAKRFQNANRSITDVRQANAETLSAIDVIVGGFPCQPFSIAGRQQGADDDRYLWDEMLRVIADFRPAWVIGENVAAIASMAEPIGKPQMVSKAITRLGNIDSYEAVYTQQQIVYLESFCQDLEEIGYTVQPLIIPAAGIGAYHRRNRVWILAHANGARLEGRTLAGSVRESRA